MEGITCVCNMYGAQGKKKEGRRKDQRCRSALDLVTGMCVRTLLSMVVQFIVMVWTSIPSSIRILFLGSNSMLSLAPLIVCLACLALPGPLFGFGRSHLRPWIITPRGKLERCYSA